MSLSESGHSSPQRGRPAGYGRRATAALIDAFVVTFPLIAVMTAILLPRLDDPAYQTGSAADATSLAALMPGLWFSVAFFAAWVAISSIYGPLLMRRAGARNGQTLGKQLLGLRVVRDNGEPFDFASAFKREAVIKTLGIGLVGQIPVAGLIAYFGNYLWPLWDDQRRAGHDLVAKTHVVEAEVEPGLAVADHHAHGGDHDAAQRDL